jgi:ABC-2 type transport system ATP-binding protein
MSALLRVTNYKKSYHMGPDLVLDIPSLTLNKGLYWLQGANGSGKTTLMKSIAGLIPFEGDIVVEDINARKQKMAYRRIVNWAEAEPVFPDFLTGNDLFDFYTSTKKGSAQNARDLAALIGIEKHLHQKTGSYSSGMLKKLSLALAFTGQPKLILLDEPLITLDAAAMEVFLKIMQEHLQNGVSFLISSHQPLDIYPASLLSISNKTISIP